MPRQMLEVQLETVTPLFLAGADGRTPELRPASFRGALRFWLRVLLGSALGENLKVLQKEEAAVLGSTEGASPVVVRTSARVPVASRLKPGSRRPLPHSDRRQFSLPAFIENGQFMLTLAPRPGQPDLPDRALAALLLLLNLGGVGKRSRRGFGSLRAVDVQAEGLVLPDKVERLLTRTPANGSALVEYIRQAIAWASTTVQNVEGGFPYDINAWPAYPVLSCHHAKILVCRHAFDNYQQAMVDFWKKVLRHKDYRDKRAYGYADGGRRASPLLLHIARSQQGYHLVLTAFRSKPAPAGRAGWSKVWKALEACRSKWQGEYVYGNREAW